MRSISTTDLFPHSFCSQFCPQVSPVHLARNYSELSFFGHTSGMNVTEATAPLFVLIRTNPYRNIMYRANNRVVSQT